MFNLLCCSFAVSGKPSWLWWLSVSRVISFRKLSSECSGYWRIFIKFGFLLSFTKNSDSFGKYIFIILKRIRGKFEAYKKHSWCFWVCFKYCSVSWKLIFINLLIFPLPAFCLLISHRLLNIVYSYWVCIISLSIVMLRILLLYLQTL